MNIRIICKEEELETIHEILLTGMLNASDKVQSEIHHLNGLTVTYDIANKADVSLQKYDYLRIVKE